jgi:large subunit ribosomal protein L10
MPRPEKELVVNEVAESLAQAKGIYLTDFTGLNVEEMNELRREFRQASVQYRVVKNTLARKSVTDAGYENLLEFLNGPTAFAFSNDDPSAPARIIRDFAKTREKPTIKALVFEGQVFDSSRVDQIAKIPSREILLSQLLGTLQTPMINFVNTLHGILSKFVRTLDAIKEQKEA